jgi:hypothetical protein
MDNRILNPSGEPDSSAAITCEHTYSALELGEMMNHNPLDLLELNIGYQTRWFNCDYIEEILSFVNDEGKMQMLMTLIVVDWRKKIAEHHPHVAYRSPETKAFVPFVEDLEIKLDAICKRLLAEREEIQQADLFRKQFMEQYSQPTSHRADSNMPQPQVHLHSIFNNVVNEENEDGELEFRMEDFDRYKLRCLTISDDKTFDSFVKLMRNKVWPFVKNNKNKYCNALRFVCMVHGIVGEKTSMPEFDDLLQGIIPGIGSQLSSMKQRQDANKKKNLINYRDPIKRRNNDCYQLTNDCPDIEERLQPVIDAINNNQKITEA